MAQLSPEQLVQLEGFFTSQLETRVTATRAALQAELTAQVGSRFTEVQTESAGLRAELAVMRAEKGQLEERLVEARASIDDSRRQITAGNAAYAALQSQGAQYLEEMRTAVAAARAEADALRAQFAGAADPAAAAASGGAGGESRVDKKELGRLFSDEKAPRFSGNKDHWAEWELRFRDKIDRSIEGGHAILRHVEQFGDGGNPDVVPFDDTAVADRGWTAVSKAVYSALTSCCPVGSTPSLHLAALSETRNGLGAWQRLKFTYRPRQVGNGATDKAKLLELVAPVAHEAGLEDALVAYESKVRQWEAAYQRILPDEDKAAALLKMMPPSTEHSGELRVLVALGMDSGQTYLELKVQVVSKLKARTAGGGSFGWDKPSGRGKTPGGPSAMDVDAAALAAVAAGKGKGKNGSSRMPSAGKNPDGKKPWRPTDAERAGFCTNPNCKQRGHDKRTCFRLHPQLAKMAADAGEGPKPKAASAVEDAGAAPLVSIGEADCCAVSADGEPGAALIPPMADPGADAPLVFVDCATDEDEEVAALSVAPVEAAAPAAMPKRGPWADLLDNAEEDTVIEAFARGELLGLTAQQEQRFADHAMSLLGREKTRLAAAVEATEEEAVEDLGWDDPACLAAQARRAAAVEAEAAKPRSCHYAGNEYMTGCTQHGVQQVTFASKNGRTGGSTNGPGGLGHWLCDTCAEYCYGQKPALARPWRPSDWGAAAAPAAAGPVQSLHEAHEAHEAARAEQAGKAAAERARAAAANKAAEERAAAACAAAERAADAATENRRAVGAVLSGQATWDTGAACGVISSKFGAGPNAEEMSSAITLTHAGGGEIQTEGKVRAVPVHTGDLISVKTGVVGAVTKDLISAHDDVGEETSPFVAVLDGPRAVLRPKEHHAEVLEKIRALVAAAVDAGPTAPLVWKDRTLRLGPARGDPQTAPRIRHAADIGGVEKAAVPAVSAAPTPAPVAGKVYIPAWGYEPVPAPAPGAPRGPTPAESAAEKKAAAASRAPAPKLAPAPGGPTVGTRPPLQAPAQGGKTAPAPKPGYAEAQLKALQEVDRLGTLLQWPIAAVRSAADALGVSRAQSKKELCKELWSRRSGGRGAGLGGP